MELVNIKVWVNGSAAKIMPVLLDHQNLSRFFSARFAVLQSAAAGQPSGGVGTIRAVTSMGKTFNEQVIGLTETKLTYRIVGAAPLKNHLGVIRLLPTANKLVTELHYVISGTSSNWVPTALIGWLLRGDISKAMAKLKDHFDAD
ncbi:SRPBCC family protein [Ferrimonas lipolytica]|uniref:SRPBCC family protein n=1 Tax=Ferrimonas lipolytica TaxID=2724191 RepID=A0A6H1UGZ3_9GAMM|nr:SRPBCC family protein [Ferrimonas lipolytica]QIZ77062.1 SRPBCC family protein [Ferrimonas lipolytica]